MALRLNTFQTTRLRPGFTLLELMVVLVVLAVLVGLAVPAYLQLLPYLEVRADARATSVTMQRARMLAANTQKPARVLLDCTTATHGSPAQPIAPCRLQTQLAVYDPGGAIKDWQTVSSGQADLHTRVMAIYATPLPTEMSQFTLFKRFFDNFKINNTPPGVTYGTAAPAAQGEGENFAGNTSFVVIFLPDGSAITAQAPLAINFVSKNFNYDAQRLSWRLSIGNTTGRIGLDRKSQTGG